MKPLFAEQYKNVAGKNAWTRSWAGRHVLGTHGLPLLQITHRHAGVLDVRATGKARYFDRGARRGVAEFEAQRIVLVHDPHRDVRCQVGIDENHVAEIEARGFHDRLHAVESEVHLGCRIVRNLAGGGIAAGHGGKEQRSRVRMPGEADSSDL